MYRLFLRSCSFFIGTAGLVLLTLGFLFGTAKPAYAQTGGCGPNNSCNLCGPPFCGPVVQGGCSTASCCNGTPPCAGCYCPPCPNPNGGYSCTCVASC